MNYDEEYNKRLLRGYYGTVREVELLNIEITKIRDILDRDYESELDIRLTLLKERRKYLFEYSKPINGFTLY